MISAIWSTNMPRAPPPPGRYWQRLSSQVFGPEVTLPVKLHVPAKRYLCAVDAAYFSGLSAASVTSLKVQGGPFSEEEAAHFIAQPHAADAVRLRRWDDLGKTPNKSTPGLDHFLG